MRKIALPFAALAATLVLFLHAAPAQAQATRTWVSGVGNDANPCSRTAPCKTFAGAITKTATGGEINCTDPGGFGTVTITKSITIDCGGTFGSILASGANGIVISAALPASSVVTLRNLSIDGVFGGITGIRWLAGTGTLNVQNVNIFGGFTLKGIEFAPTGNAKLFVSDTTIAEVGGAVATNAAITIVPTAGAAAVISLNRVVLKDSANGLLLDSTNSGVLNLSVRDSVLTGNANSGLTSTAGPRIFVESHASTFVGNTTGIFSSGANSFVFLHLSMVAGNSSGLSTANGGNIVSFTSNVTNGNLTTNNAPTNTFPQE